MLAAPRSVFRSAPSPRLSLSLLLLVAVASCTTINTQSAVRLSGEAQLTTRAMIDSLEGTRRSLSTYVEGQALS